jgi:hypothetical protein
MNLIKKIFTFSNKHRSCIDDDSKEPVRYAHSKTLQEAKDFAERLELELRLIKQVDDLLNAPMIKRNKDKHLMLTLPPKEWLNNGKPLIVLFSLETGKAISAYFDQED